MDRTYIKKLHIEHVRHLRNIEIALDNGDGPRHLILTGANGSGKTSVLDALAKYLDAVRQDNGPELFREFIGDEERTLRYKKENGAPAAEIRDVEKRIVAWKEKLADAKQGLTVEFNTSEGDLRHSFDDGNLILAHFGAQRAFRAEVPDYIEKVRFKEHYGPEDSPRRLFVKYLLDLKMTQALAASEGRSERASEIQGWFDKIQDILRTIYEDPTLAIEFDADTYHFNIQTRGRDRFDFNEASDGFSAILDVVVGIMLRTVRGKSHAIRFDTPGIVLIDEIENHLHLSLQRSILPFLIGLFPNVQFVVSSHSPFVLTSAPDVVVYDLQNNIMVDDGMTDNTYESVVRGYFEVDSLSKDLREKYERYKLLTRKEDPTGEDLVEIAQLELYLDEIPDYLALDVATEYKKYKIEFHGGRSN